jgi:hypothetical protein
MNFSICPNKYEYAVLKFMSLYEYPSAPYKLAFAFALNIGIQSIE